MKALLAASLAVLIATTASAQTSSSFAVAKCDPDAVIFSNVHLPQAVLAGIMVEYR